MYVCMCVDMKYPLPMTGNWKIDVTSTSNKKQQQEKATAQIVKSSMTVWETVFSSVKVIENNKNTKKEKC